MEAAFSFQCARCDKLSESFAEPGPRTCCYECTRKYFREAVRAHAAVARARRAGKLDDPRSLQCVDCGNQARYYDHRCYGRPLDVQPVCASCNQLRGNAAWSPLTAAEKQLAASVDLLSHSVFEAPDCAAVTLVAAA